MVAKSLIASLLLGVVAADWSVESARLTVGRKTVTFAEVSDVLEVDPKSQLEVTFDAQFDESSAPAHQMMVKLTDPTTQLDFMYPAKSLKGGHAKAVIAPENVPLALQSRPLRVSALVGSSAGSDIEESMALVSFPATGAYQAPSRLGPKPELRHTFRGDPKHASKFIASVFSGAVLFAFAVLVAYWLFAAKGNVGSLPAALAKSPLGHLGFLASIGAFEYIFASYFLGESIFATVEKAALVAIVAVFAGSRALREVRARRVEGKF